MFFGYMVVLLMLADSFRVGMMIEIDGFMMPDQPTSRAPEQLDPAPAVHAKQ